MIYLIIRDNYVINRVVANELLTEYPWPHDLILEDVNASVFIGDWYEQSESIFYRPIGIPHDWPDELKQRVGDGQE